MNTDPVYVYNGMDKLKNLDMRCKIVWVCSGRDSYEHAHHWMEKSGRVCTMELR